MNIWFTADTHFNHANIIKYCGRPFKDVNHMNEELIRRWNERVKEGDTIFHLGDFMLKTSIKPPSHFLSRLNGRMVHVRGNHDQSNGLKTVINYMEIHYGGKDIFLSHRPEFVAPINFCGHIHQKWKYDSQVVGNSTIFYVVNVGVDVWNFYPVNISEIMKGLFQYINPPKEWEKLIFGETKNE